MDNWLEFLVPLIILAVYFFGGMFGKKDGAEGEADPRTRSAEEEAEAAERQRVQEEIRQRILERRRAAEAGEKSPGERGGASSAPVAPPPMPRERQRREATTPPPRRPMNVPQPPARPTAPQHPGRPEDPQFSWSDNREQSLTDELRRRREQIAETQRKADELRRSHKLDILGEKKPQAARRERGTSASLRMPSARDLVRDPRAARQAIILSEIIGKPVSLREGQSSLPT